MSSLFDIDSYLDSLDDLPENLRTKCSTMHHLGVKNKGMINDIDLASDEYLRKIKELSPEKKRIEKEKIQKMFNLSKKYSDKKVKIAIETYELVDEHIRELDIALAKLEENIRLRETESELSEEEILEEEVKKEPKKKTKTKKRAVKNQTNQHSEKSSKYGDSGRKIPDVENKKTAKSEDHSSSSKSEEKKSLKSEDLKQKFEKSEDESDFKKKNTNSSEDIKKKSTKHEEDAKKRSASVDHDKKRVKKSEENENLVNQVHPEHLNMAVDPNEPTYCFCRQVSFGDMIGCDNEDCSIEWFHFECLGITVLPKGKWYCPDCLPSSKKKPTIKRFVSH